MPHFKATIFWRIAATFLLLQSGAALAEGVDLHAHYFMPEASGFPGLGSFEGPLYARSWSDRLKTRVNSESLDQSRVKIAVVALYAHPFFFGSQRDVIRRQIESVRRFVEKHPDWVIARSASEARQKLAEGKRLLVLSIEGASRIIESEADVQEFVDRLGVRIITPVHFTDDRIGGAAFMPGIEIWVNPIAALKSFFSPARDSDGVRLNPQGLTRGGSQLIDLMIRHGVWIDLSHASDASYRDILPHLTQAGQPPLVTHTILRSAFHAERGITPLHLEEIRAKHGIVGLLPSDDMLKGTQVDPRFCPKECAGHCDGGIASFLTQFHQIAQTVPAASVMIGSDIDAPLTFLKPSCEASEKKNPKGFWDYAQISEIEDALIENRLIHSGNDWVEAFLEAWQQVKAPQPETENRADPAKDSH